MKFQIERQSGGATTTTTIQTTPTSTAIPARAPGDTSNSAATEFFDEDSCAYNILHNKIPLLQRYERYQF